MCTHMCHSVSVQVRGQHSEVDCPFPPLDAGMELGLTGLPHVLLLTGLHCGFDFHFLIIRDIEYF